MKVTRPRDSYAAGADLSRARQLALVGVPLALGILLANVLPDDWNRSNGPLAALTKVMTSIVPSINSLTRLSEFPGVTETYLSIVWMTVPFMVVLMLRTKGLFKTDSMGELRHKLGFVCLALLFLSPLILLPIFWPATQSHLVGPTLVALISRAVSESRTWLGGMGALVCWGCAIGIALVFSILKNVPFLLLGKHR